MKTYISGPIKGVDDYRNNFLDAFEELVSWGHTPISPVYVGDDLEHRLGREPSYEEFMRADVLAMLECEAIYMLRGWERSNGAKLEFQVAAMTGMKVLYE